MCYVAEANIRLVFKEPFDWRSVRIAVFYCSPFFDLVALEMKNIIISKCIDAFKKNYGIYEKRDDLSFEHFANYCVVSKFCQEAYQEDPIFYECIHTGSGGDYGIDGILVLVNDLPITDTEQLNGLQSKKWRVHFVFVQSKTTPGFDSGDMLKTGAGVQDILNFDSSRANDKLSRYISLVKAIYDEAEKFECNPECSIFFVTTGIWNDDPNLIATKGKVEEGIRKLQLTGHTEFIPVDSDRLLTMYREVTNSVTKTIQMAKSVPFSEIDGVKEAFVGLVEIRELLKLITDEGDMLQNNIFYENVRGFLGYNPVNSEIRNTLCSHGEAIRFPILNNGVTIVTKELRHVSDKFTMTNFQIVNGCQTCNVIYQCRGEDISNSYCVLKIICTEDTDIITEVIKSTNRQSQVLDEAFESLKKIHKKIQDYFDAIEPEHKLYYERRSREFDGTESIDRHKVVTLTTLIKSYVAMFLEEPHSTHRYYGELLKSYNDRLFCENDKPILYYTAAWCLHKVDNILAADNKFAAIRKYRFHLVLLIARLAAKRPRPFRASSHEAEKYCVAVCEVLNDDMALRKHMTMAVEKLMETLEVMPSMHGDSLLRKKEFTTALLERL